MQSKIVISAIMISSMFLLGNNGCRWQDDFRSREHPRVSEPEYKPTFNSDSPYYVGDDVASGREVQKEVPLDDIDGLSNIPEVPEHPSQM